MLAYPCLFSSLGLYLSGFVKAPPSKTLVIFVGII
jgi:hypothetical protein